jgi:hypothetical protein
MQRIRNLNRSEEHREAQQPEDAQVLLHSQREQLSPQLVDSNEMPRKKNIQIHSGAVWKTRNSPKSDQLSQQRSSRSPVTTIQRSASRRVNPVIRRFIQRRTK